MRNFVHELMKKAYFLIPPRIRPYAFSAIFGNKHIRRWLGPFAFRSLGRNSGLERVHKGERPLNTRPTPEFAQPIPNLEAYQPRNDLRTLGKIGVVIHAYYLELLPELLGQLHNIPTEFSLFITTPNELVDSVTTITSKSGFEAKIIGVENEGYDLLPFAEILSVLISNGIEVVCKLHTKKGAANLEGLYPNIETLWSDLLVKPIVGSASTVACILDAFATHPDLGMVGSASMYKSAQDLMYGNHADVNKIVDLIDPRELPLKNWGFFAGSMFWCRIACVEPLRVLANHDATQCNSRTGEIASFWHALERVLGLLPLIVNYRVALSFAQNLENSRHAVSILQPAHEKLLLNPMGIGITLATELSIRDDREALRAVVSEEHLLKSNAADLEIEPILYYLRYGVFFGEELIGDFNSHAYWHLHQDVFQQRLNPLVHYFDIGRSEKRITFPAKQNLDAARRILRRSSLFNRQFYVAENPEIAMSEEDPLGHFCEIGWMELRDPSSQFETWNYWQTHLDPKRAIINPAVYDAVLNANGHPKPIRNPISLSEGCELPSDRPIKRLCLFAGYDPLDVIDESVIDYIKEISKYADVYYLSDGEMPESQLRRLNGLVKNAWSMPHGQYDFGSYSKLALRLVGWDEVKKYDELILANDSCYLIRSLGPIFKKMESSKCDWWGLQATKGIRKTMSNRSNRFKENIPIDAVKEFKLNEYDKEPFYDFHIGSYFLVFRDPVLSGSELKKVLYSVQSEITKLNVIRKNEIGLTRSLIRAGYSFDTYIDELLPFHPLYTERHYELIEKGFPLFKRLLLSENHYRVPDLWRWEDKLTQMIPNLDLASIKSNLVRVSSPEKLHRNLNVKRRWGIWPSYPKLYSNFGFALRDLVYKKHKNWWVFPVCAYDSQLTGNDRAVFERVKNDPSIKKIVLVRGKHIDVSGVNVKVVPLKSKVGQQLLLRSKVVFIKHTLRENIEHPLMSRIHRVIGLWHGVPLKRIGFASNDLQDRLTTITKINSQFSSVICSSEIDRLAMACGFYPLRFQDIWMTGLPRVDFVLNHVESLPTDMRAELCLLDELLGERKLLLFCPTFRNDKESSCYEFSTKEKSRLNQLLREHNVVLGVREHMTVRSSGYRSSLAGLPLLNLDGGRFKDVEMLYRRADYLMTDYSSCYMDFMVTGKPIIVFAYDFDEYAGQERGLFYELQTAVPGPVCTTFDDLVQCLEKVFAERPHKDLTGDYEIKRRMFHAFTDGENADRVVAAVKLGN